MSILSLKEPKGFPLFGSENDYEEGLFLRADIVRYPIIKQLYEAAFGKFWTTKMIDFNADKLGFTKLSPIAQRMFKLNNAYQSLMDSGVVNIYSDLAKLTKNIELAMAYTYISQNESIHALSYSEGLIQMFGDKASEVINIVYTDPVVKNRLKMEIDFADKLDKNDIYSIFKVIVATYLLEHIKFPFSFFVTFSINKAFNGAINGFSMLIKKIAEDEMEIHYPLNAYVIKTMIKENMIDEAYAMDFITSIASIIQDQELEWNKYLQKDGSIQGYTESVGEHFIRYMTNKALRDIGIKVPKIEPNDTIKWFNHYRDTSNQLVSQQEMKSNQYQKGIIKNDLYKFNKVV